MAELLGRTDVDGAGLFHGAAEGEGFGDVVGFVFEQGLLDEEIEVGLGEAEAAAVVEGLGEGVGVGQSTCSINPDTLLANTPSVPVVITMAVELAGFCRKVI